LLFLPGAIDSTVNKWHNSFGIISFELLKIQLCQEVKKIKVETRAEAVAIRADKANQKEDLHLPAKQLKRRFLKKVVKPPKVVDVVEAVKAEDNCTESKIHLGYLSRCIFFVTFQ
jgi:hypothetical protein